MRGPRTLAILLLAALLLPACASPVGVERAGADRVYAGLRANAITAGIPSASSRIVLDRHDLRGAWDRRKPDALERLLDIASGDPRRDTVLALAELHYLAFLDGWGREHALASAAFAWAYLHDPSNGPPPQAWEPGALTAADLYDRALLEALRAAPGESVVSVGAGTRDLPRGTLALTLADELKDEIAGLDLLAADDFEIRGLRVRNRRPGLGLRLVAARPRMTAPPLERGVFRGRTSSAVTALLVPEGGVADLARGRVRATLRLLDPSEVSTFEAGGAVRPLGADLTAPLAMTLDRSPTWGLETAGFFSGTSEFPPGLALLTSRPGRIPVVFVHGTASSPGRWAEMINTLMADEAVARRIQVWVFLYPTGNPVPYSAAQLRESLADAVAEMDPAGEDRALRSMVLVGHSQGGLLCRMVASAADPEPLRAEDGRTLDEMAMDPATRALVDRCTVFEASPVVARAVFLATPHRGSFFAGNWISRLMGSFVSVAHDVQGALGDRFRGRDHRIRLPEGIDLPTAVDNMIPGSRFLERYDRMTPGPGVRFHSIVAVEGEGDPAPLDDGIVAYESAHLPGAASEFVVRCGHSCQDHPLVIEEVRRILLEHVAEVFGNGKR